MNFLTYAGSRIHGLPNHVINTAASISNGHTCILALRTHRRRVHQRGTADGVYSGRSLVTLCIAMCLSLVKPRNLERIGRLSCNKTRCLRSRLLTAKLFRRTFGGPFLGRFILEDGIPMSELRRALVSNNFFKTIRVRSNLIGFYIARREDGRRISTLISLVGALGM